MGKKQDIKRAQRESYYYKEISQLLHQIAADDNRISGLFINRIELSSDGGTCTILFLTQNGKPEFEEKLKSLVLYKASLRTALAKMAHGRYTPKLFFRYDDTHEKTEKIHTLIDSLKKEGRL